MMKKQILLLTILMSLTACSSMGPNLKKMSCSDLRERVKDLKAQQKEAAIDTVITGVGSIFTKDKELDSDFETNSAVHDLTTDALEDTQKELSTRNCK
jgi:starvation-inducible outer membrane lipoprotein